MGLIVDPKTAEDIDRRNRRLLREMGISEPPLHVEDVLEHLKVHHSYYDLADPNLLQEIWHRLRIGGQKVRNLVKKIDLKGLWLPDSDKILVDEAVPNSKRKWVNAHEIQHRLNPNHQYLLGDTAETLDPTYQEILENEANYGASSMIFLCDRFTSEARDCAVEMASVRTLAKRYKNSLSTTLRRFVQNSHEIPLAGLISVPRWKDPFNTASRCRHFVRSDAFARRFSNVQPADLLSRIDGLASYCRGGPAGGGTVMVPDVNGAHHVFSSEIFFNSYDLLTIVRHIGAATHSFAVP